MGGAFKCVFILKVWMKLLLLFEHVFINIVVFFFIFVIPIHNMSFHDTKHVKQI